MRKLTSKTAITALLATTYFVISIAIGDLSFSWVQIRISESLTPLPFILGYPAVIGLTLGCALTNLVSPVGLPDLLFGPALTLFAALLSWKANFGKRMLSCIYPVIVNAFGVSVYVSSFYGIPYLFALFTITVGEVIAAIIVGYPLVVAIEKKYLDFFPKK